MFEDFWKRFVSRNPSISIPDQKITLTSAELKRQMERAYNAGMVSAAFDDDKKEDSVFDFLGRTFFGK